MAGLKYISRKNSKRRKTKLLLRRITVIAVAILIILALILLIKLFSDITSKPQPPTDTPSESASPSEVPTNEINNKYYFDPDSFSESERIDPAKYSLEILPEVYSNPGYDYDTFAQDTVTLGSNEKKVIVIDAGHQYQTTIIKADVWMSPYLDPAKSSSWTYNHLMQTGATGVSTKIPEYRTSHTLAAKLKAELESLGYTVYLSHPDINALISAAERSAVANRNNADIMISLHCNFDSEYSTTRGVEVYYPAVYDGYPSKRLSYLSENLANVLLDEYTNATGFKPRFTKSWTDTSLFAFCKCPIVLFELGYSSTPAEDILMNDDDFQQTMVEGLTRGICKYFALIKN